MILAVKKSNGNTISKISVKQFFSFDESSYFVGKAIKIYAGKKYRALYSIKNNFDIRILPKLQTDIY